MICSVLIWPREIRGHIASGVIIAMMSEQVRHTLEPGSAPDSRSACLGSSCSRRAWYSENRIRLQTIAVAPFIMYMSSGKRSASMDRTAVYKNGSSACRKLVSGATASVFPGARFAFGDHPVPRAFPRLKAVAYPLGLSQGRACDNGLPEPDWPGHEPGAKLWRLWVIPPQSL